MKTIMKEQKKEKNHAAAHKACAATLCAAMLLTLAGCSAESGKEPAEGEIVMSSEQQTTEGTETTDTTTPAAAEDTDAADSTTPAAAKDTDTADPTSPAAATEQNGPEEAPASSGAIHVSGDITSVEDGSFTVSIELDNAKAYGEDVESSSGEETTTISLTVRYTQDTQFLIEFVSSDGSSSSQSEGTSADLENGRMVILDGIMENEVFKAETIKILQFV